jgi:hypothetical protein
MSDTWIIILTILIFIYFCVAVFLGIVFYVDSQFDGWNFNIKTVLLVIFWLPVAIGLLFLDLLGRMGITIT